MEVYAYYSKTDEGVREQCLEEHIEESLKAFENEIKNTKVWKYYVNSCKHDERIIEKWMKFAITFHDIGKMLYQRNFGHYNGKTYLNFTGHEFFSTFLADKFLNIWLEKDVENRITEYGDFRWIVYASILYHHHAMGLRSRERLNVIKVCEENEFNEIVKAIYRILLSNLEDFEEDVIVSFVNELRSLNLTKSRGRLILDRNVISDVFRYVDELNIKIWENFVGIDEFRKLMILSTNLLILADYKGSERRGGKPTNFGKVLNEFIELYKIKEFAKF